MRTEEEIKEQIEKRKRLCISTKKDGDVLEENYHEGWLNALVWVLNE